MKNPLAIIIILLVLYFVFVKKGNFSIPDDKNPTDVNSNAAKYTMGKPSTPTKIRGTRMIHDKYATGSPGPSTTIGGKN